MAREQKSVIRQRASEIGHGFADNYEIGFLLPLTVDQELDTAKSLPLFLFRRTRRGCDKALEIEKKKRERDRN